MYSSELSALHIGTVLYLNDEGKLDQEGEEDEEDEEEGGGVPPAGGQDHAHGRVMIRGQEASDFSRGFSRSQVFLGQRLLGLDDNLLFNYSTNGIQISLLVKVLGFF